MRQLGRITAAAHSAVMLIAFAPAIEAAHASSEATPSAARVKQSEVTQLIVKLKGPRAGELATGLSHAQDTAAVLERVIGRALRPLQDAHPRARRSPTAVRYAREMSGAAHVIGLGTPVTDEYAAELAKRIEAEPEIEYAQPDYRMYAQLEPSDPLYAQQWGYHDPAGGANVNKAWDATTGSANVVTAVVDTGYRMHPELAANMLPGYDFITDTFIANDGDGRDADASDPGDWIASDELPQCGLTLRGVADSSWHGTHVAGTIGAMANNGAGGVGVNWQGRIVPVRVLGKCGGQVSDIIDGIRWAAGLPVPHVPANAHPAKIVNVSLGTSLPCGSATQDAIDDVTKQGASVVAAAGNSNDEVGQPASCRGVIAVAAIDAQGNKAAFSNFGARIDIGAPGVDIVSTANAGVTVPAEHNYFSYSGTSMAAPHVAGAIGLMLAVDPTLTPDAIRAKLMASARPYSEGSSCAKNENATMCGPGMLDAARAVEAARPVTEASR